VRRFIVTLLLSVMAWSYAAPAALAITEINTPACCRREGTHHCKAGISGAQAEPGVALVSMQANPSACPYHSPIAAPIGAAHLRSSTLSRLSPPSEAVLAIAGWHSIELLVLTSNWERGPPSLYL
jgi:hypothetical protein